MNTFSGIAYRFIHTKFSQSLAKQMCNKNMALKNVLLFVSLHLLLLVICAITNWLSTRFQYISRFMFVTAVHFYTKTISKNFNFRTHTFLIVWMIRIRFVVCVCVCFLFWFLLNIHTDTLDGGVKQLNSCGSRVFIAI